MLEKELNRPFFFFQISGWFQNFLNESEQNPIKSNGRNRLGFVWRVGFNVSIVSKSYESKLRQKFRRLKKNSEILVGIIAVKNLAKFS